MAAGVSATRPGPCNGVRAGLEGGLGTSLLSTPPCSGYGSNLKIAFCFCRSCVKFTLHKMNPLSVCFIGVGYIPLCCATVTSGPRVLLIIPVESPGH
jgi:hypothetical protein